MVTFGEVLISSCVMGGMDLLLLKVNRVDIKTDSVQEKKSVE